MVRYTGTLLVDLKGYPNVLTATGTPSAAAGVRKWLDGHKDQWAVMPDVHDLNFGAVAGELARRPCLFEPHRSNGQAGMAEGRNADDRNALGGPDRRARSSPKFQKTV